MGNTLWLQRAGVPIHFHLQISDGFVQDCGNSSADALELPQSDTKPLNYYMEYIVMKIWIDRLTMIIPYVLNSLEDLHFILPIVMEMA